MVVFDHVDRRVDYADNEIRPVFRLKRISGCALLDFSCGVGWCLLVVKEILEGDKGIISTTPYNMGYASAGAGE